MATPAGLEPATYCLEGTKVEPAGDIARFLYIPKYLPHLVFLAHDVLRGFPHCRSRDTYV